MEKYEVISTLGRGAGGIVSLAREKNSARFGFVMKIIINFLIQLFGVIL